MAEKFSQFNTESTLSSITGLVGYISGSPGSNVRISPTDLLAGIPPSGVATFDMGTTGLTPTTPTAGNVSVGGTLVAGSGGTGRSSYNIGSLLVSDSVSSLGELNAGAATTVLTSNGPGVVPSWQPAAGGGGSYWTPKVQSSTPYNAVAGDFIIATVTTTLRINLPAGASDGDMVGVKYSTQSATTDTLLIYTDAVGVTIDGVDRSSTPLAIPALQTYYEFIADGGNWFIK